MPPAPTTGGNNNDDDAWFDDFVEDSYQADSSSFLDDETLKVIGNDDDDSDDNDTPLQGELAIPAPASRRPPYTIITKFNLENMQQEALGQVQSILGCTSTTARALLTFFSWDAESVLSTIAERGEEEVYKRAGVIPRTAEAATTTSLSVQLPPPSSSAPSSSSCAVCFSDIPPGTTVAMSCGHGFCEDCWRQHISIAVREGQSRRVACMLPGCGVLCDEDQVKCLLADDCELLEKYNQGLIDGYVDDNARVRWCPSVPHCGTAVRVNSDPHCEITCTCGKEFCFVCGEEPHSPATCDMARAWKRRIQDGTETASWLNANTKPCPKCTKPVEKNGGCNLVVCHCGQAFCWLCGQATGRAHNWTVIQGHSCGAYKEEAENRQNEGQRNLKRYLHYLTRYEAHLNSLTLEERARRELDEKIDAMVESETYLANFSWVHEALSQLFLARRVMAYSYVFAFYIFGPDFAGEFVTKEMSSVNKGLFEDKQGQLEEEVERLANIMERNQDTLGEQRLSVINLASSINSRIVKMYDVIENEIAPQVAGRSMNIAAYKGQRSRANGSAMEVVMAAVTMRATNERLLFEKPEKEKEKKKGGAGGGHKNTASTSGAAPEKTEMEIIDLTVDDDDYHGGGNSGGGNSGGGNGGGGGLQRLPSSGLKRQRQN